MGKRRQPAALARYWAGKRGGRSRTRTRTIVRTRTRHVTHRRGRRRGGSGGGLPLGPFLLASAGIGYLTGDNTPIPQISANVAKIPGAKTFGNAAALGLVCLAANKFIKPNKWLKLAGYAGLAVAAVKAGSQGSKFQWLGDVDGDDDVMADVDGDDY